MNLFSVLCRRHAEIQKLVGRGKSRFFFHNIQDFPFSAGLFVCFFEIMFFVVVVVVVVSFCAGGVQFRKLDHRSLTYSSHPLGYQLLRYSVLYPPEKDILI